MALTYEQAQSIVRSTPKAELLSPAFWSSHPEFWNRDDKNAIQRAVNDRYAQGPMGPVSLAADIRDGAPQFYQYLQDTASPSGGFFTGLRDAAQGAVANFVAPALTGGLSTLANDVWSKGAQEYIDPSLQGVAGIAGLSGYANNYLNPSASAPTASIPSSVGTSTGTGLTASGGGFGATGTGFGTSALTAAPSGSAFGGLSAGDAALSATGGASSGLFGMSPSTWGTIGKTALDLAPSVLGYMGAEKMAGQQSDLSNKLFATGAPYRQSLAQLYANPSAYLSSPEVQVPVQQGTDALARSLSVQGNPMGSGNALTELQGYATKQYYDRLQDEKNRLANYGGLSAFNSAAPQGAQNAIDAGSRKSDAVGVGIETLANLYNKGTLGKIYNGVFG